MKTGSYDVFICRKKCIEAGERLAESLSFKGYRVLRMQTFSHVERHADGSSSQGYRGFVTSTHAGSLFHTPIIEEGNENG